MGTLRKYPKPQIGGNYGKWTVLCPARHPNGYKGWLCRCGGCGIEKIVTESSLLSGGSKSCKSCAFRKHPKFQAGDTYGEWEIESLDRERSEATGRRHWWCVCVCGARVSVAEGNLASGASKRCTECSHGRARTHGLTGTGTYSSYKLMHGRCEDPEHPDYPDYGARGIRVCERWSGDEGPFNFYADMGDRPPKLTIGRIDNDGHYEPQNCRWETRVQQAQNRRSTHWLTINGETRCVAEWARHFGIGVTTIRYRLAQGWTPEDAVSVPLRARNRWTKMAMGVAA